MAILLAVTIGLTPGAIIGALVAAPVLAVASTILAYLRERADEDAVGALQDAGKGAF